MERIRYGKPVMTNLPPELGRRIFTQILNSTKPDYDKMHKESMRLEAEMKRELANHSVENAQQASRKLSSLWASPEDEPVEKIARRMRRVSYS